VITLAFTVYSTCSKRTSWSSVFLQHLQQALQHEGIVQKRILRSEKKRPQPTRLGPTSFNSSVRKPLSPRPTNVMTYVGWFWKCVMIISLCYTFSRQYTTAESFIFGLTQPIWTQLSFGTSASAACKHIQTNKHTEIWKARVTKLRVVLRSLGPGQSQGWGPQN